MIDATRIFDGCAFLIRARRPTHQSRGFIEMRGVCASARKNFVLGPATFVTGWRPIVFVSTPPHPASKARMMFVSDSVGGVDARRKGFSNRIPVKTVERSAA